MKHQVSYTFRLAETLQQLAGDGLLLAATRPDNTSNVMTIGWATIGFIWGKPIFSILVRPSRHTYQFIEESGAFSVNVPTPEMREFVHFCGTKSGREYDKLARFDQAVTMGQAVNAVTIDACPLVYECRVVHKHDLLPETLDPTIRSRLYSGGDFHRVYHGEILGTWAL